MEMVSELEKELQRWRENRSRQRSGTIAAADSLFRPRTATARTASNAAHDARTVQVNGQPVLVVRRQKRPA